MLQALLAAENEGAALAGNQDADEDEDDEGGEEEDADEEGEGAAGAQGAAAPENAPKQACGTGV